MVDVSTDGLEQTAAEFGDAGGKAIALRLDVADLAQQERAVAATVEAYGYLRAALNAAGISGPNARLTELAWPSP